MKKAHHHDLGQQGVRNLTLQYISLLIHSLGLRWLLYELNSKTFEICMRLLVVSEQLAFIIEFSEALVHWALSANGPGNLTTLLVFL